METMNRWQQEYGSATNQSNLLIQSIWILWGRIHPMCRVQRDKNSNQTMCTLRHQLHGHGSKFKCQTNRTVQVMLTWFWDILGMSHHVPYHSNKMSQNNIEYLYLYSNLCKWTLKDLCPKCCPWWIPIKINWLVVYLPLKKNFLGVWFPIYGKIKTVPNHQLVNTHQATDYHRPAC